MGQPLDPLATIAAAHQRVLQRLFCTCNMFLSSSTSKDEDLSHNCSEARHGCSSFLDLSNHHKCRKAGKLCVAHPIWIRMHSRGESHPSRGCADATRAVKLAKACRLSLPFKSSGLSRAYLKARSVAFSRSCASTCRLKASSPQGIVRTA